MSSLKDFGYGVLTQGSGPAAKKQQQAESETAYAAIASNEKIAADQLELLKQQLEEQQKQYELLKAEQEPWLEAGKKALAELKAMPAFAETFNSPEWQEVEMGDITKFFDPSAGTRYEQGMTALDRTMAAQGRGSAMSAELAKGQFGGEFAANETAKAEALQMEDYYKRYGESVDTYNRAYGMEADRYNKALQDYTRKMNELQSVAKVGITSTDKLEVSGGQMANNYGVMAAQQGNIYANLGQVNAQAYGQVGNSYQNYANTMMNWNKQTGQNVGYLAQQNWGGGGNTEDDEWKTYGQGDWGK